ncbi:hypothetical protein JRC04_04610 [Mycolicibacterium sp. S2-37]|uniref:hypothetical protein n=1 Tax=Mycolicibacterium sp. S2-37 TaxID=2810297 RepID=UPI001A93BE99|nr:hypothetical protein [Mycolicibacterium sp. S2-37]MBO0676740.1 hypothetical protein [Mycolicibacterium sp. S2-37]
MRVPPCGGCKGEGAHSRRCRVINPGWYYELLYDAASDLGDAIGSNDPEAANMAYAIAGRMRERVNQKKAEAVH